MGSWHQEASKLFFPISAKGGEASPTSSLTALTVVSQGLMGSTCLPPALPDGKHLLSWGPGAAAEAP